MTRPSLEVADIFREHGSAWRRANAGHVSLGQLKAMSAIERCRTAALGGHVARCEGCAHTAVSFNSCRSRSCPKCQSSAARKWLAEREAELLEVGYSHFVYTLPAAVADIAWQNKAVVYGLLFKAFDHARSLGRKVPLWACCNTPLLLRVQSVIRQPITSLRMSANTTTLPIAAAERSTPYHSTPVVAAKVGDG